METKCEYGEIIAEPQSLSFTMKEGEMPMRDQRLRLSSTGGLSSSFTLYIAENWLRVYPMSGETSQVMNVSVRTPAAVLKRAGTYIAEIIVTSSSATNTPFGIKVTLVVEGKPIPEPPAPIPPPEPEPPAPPEPQPEPPPTPEPPAPEPSRPSWLDRLIEWLNHFFGI